MSLPIAHVSERNWQPNRQPEAAPRASAVPSAASPPFSELLSRLGAALDRGERLVGHAAMGAMPTDDAAALIAVQAGIYRYTETVELAAKLVDATANATRTALQSGS